jgi:hypothetical protein
MKEKIFSSGKCVLAFFKICELLKISLAFFKVANQVNVFDQIKTILIFSWKHKSIKLIIDLCFPNQFNSKIF